MFPSSPGRKHAPAETRSFLTQSPPSAHKDVNLKESSKPEDTLLITSELIKEESGRQRSRIIYSQLRDFTYGSHPRPKTWHGVVLLYGGDCNVVKRADTAIHVLINILATALFSISNLTMQLLAAPTREEVDKAHAKATWLDIGVPSFRNLRQISRSNCTMWSVLALSSLPIHFLYNSTVFSSLTGNGVAFVTAHESFLEGPSWTNETATPFIPVIHGHGPPNTTTNTFEIISAIHNDYRNNTSLYENHTTYECLSAYMNPFSWRPRLLIMISSNESVLNNSATYIDWGIQTSAPDAVAHLLCDGETAMSKKCAALDTLTSDTIGPVTFRGQTIDYCLYKPTDIGASEVKTCHLQGSPQILLVVAIFNAVKCLCIMWVLLFDRRATLCTLGDAVASFLETPDEHTLDLGITSKASIEDLGKGWSSSQGSLVRWQPQSIPWRRAASARRWTLTIVSSVCIIIAGWWIIGTGLRTQRVYNRSISVTSLWAMGFGETKVEEIVSWNQANEGRLGLFVNILIANIWQVVIALAYTAHNALLSSLRVTKPKGSQRSSYMLSMPFKYSISMQVVSSLMHWLLSQSTFIIRVNRISWLGKPDGGWTTGGYSLVPGILAGVFFPLILLTQIVHACVRKYPRTKAIPLASTCSAAISAACHRLDADREAHLHPVQWGVIGRDEAGRGRCSFTTSKSVAPPMLEENYLGLRPVPNKHGFRRFLSARQ